MHVGTTQADAGVGGCPYYLSFVLALHSTLRCQCSSHSQNSHTAAGSACLYANGEGAPRGAQARSDGHRRHLLIVWRVGAVAALVQCTRMARQADQGFSNFPLLVSTGILPDRLHVGA